MARLRAIEPQPRRLGSAVAFALPQHAYNVTSRRECGKRGGRRPSATRVQCDGHGVTPRVRPLRWSLALVTVPTAPLGSQTCTHLRGTIYFNPRAHSGYVTDDR
eukprot:scaffold8850_cov72-Phaeocystis_antarctica.AAC.16